MGKASLNVFALALFLVTNVARRALVTYDFDVSWTYANPDGLQTRPVIGINGQWPLPTLRATKGDRLIVHVKNSLGNETTSLHFRGLYQNGTTHMDGSAQVSQCAIQPGESFTYNLTIDQPGTYWYHSHVRGQYPDGFRGPLVVHDPQDPQRDQFDEEMTLTFSDWYHDSMPKLLESFMSVANPSGAEPVPDSALINDTQNIDIRVRPGKTYKIRMINVGAFASQYVWFEDHTMRIVEVDGVYTEPAHADMIYLTAGQRYSVLVTAKQDSDANFAIVSSMDQELFDTIPDGLNPNATAWLVYDDEKERPKPQIKSTFAPFDDFALVPSDRLTLYDHVDRSIQLDIKMGNLGNGANYAFFNDITYVPPKVPTLYTVLSSGANATDVSIYGSNTGSFVLEAHEVIEIVLNNDDPGKHPFHIHGHTFQVVHRSEEGAGFYDPTTTDFPSIPMRRDTVAVNPNGNVVLRFRSDNPGVWLFHCHIEWHVASGLIATFVEAPLALQAQLGGKIPQDHLEACKAGNIPTSGNAAGHTADWLDLTSENKPPAPLPAGFTAKGIVALVFSCLSAFMGMGVIAWYGWGV